MALFLPADLTRRDFLTRSAAAAGALGSGLAAAPFLRADDKKGAKSKRPRVACIYTELRFRSHAYNFLDNFLEPYMFCGKLVDAGCDVVSLYADQFPENDMSRDFSRRHKIPLFPTIAEALCLGGKDLAVDAVLLIGEHGDYPENERGQVMYPRKRFFDEIVAVMKRSGRSVPLFNDKHLSFRWDWAKEMYDTSRELGFEMMAGSSVPLGQRIPPIDVAAGTEIEEAVAVHGGGIESYDFHALELLQSFVEFRKGGETGISKVELLSGDALQKAADEGRWSRDLLNAALQAEKSSNVKRQLRPDAEERGKPQERVVKYDESPLPKFVQPSHGLLVTYKDGFRGGAFKVLNWASRWDFACQVRGEERPRATAIYNGSWGNRGMFKALSHAIQSLFRTGEPPYPVERTLLVSGVLEAAMQSHEAGGKPIETPHLEFGYRCRDFGRFRENGASWKLITPDMPQPVTLDESDEAVIASHRGGK